MTSPVLEDILQVSHFGVSESFMPAPSTSICGLGHIHKWHVLASTLKEMKFSEHRRDNLGGF